MGFMTSIDDMVMGSPDDDDDDLDAELRALQGGGSNDISSKKKGLIELFSFTLIQIAIL